MADSKKIITLYIKGVIIFVPLFLFGILLYKDLVVDGVVSATYDFKNLSPFITQLHPQGRVSDPQTEDGLIFQQMYDEPVYFDVRVPRNFQKATVRLTYQNIDQPIFELGALSDENRRIFDLKPVDNRIINFLISDKFHWSYIQDGDIFLFQKKKDFDSVQAFLANLPSSNRVAVYNYILKRDFILPQYRPQRKETVINKTLRGSHRMYTYIKDEDLDFTFAFQDINRDPGDDDATLEVYRNTEKIYSNFLEIDENQSDNSEMSSILIANIKLPNLEEGVYRIEISAPADDIVIRKISTQQSKLVFINTVYLGDSVGYSDEYDTSRLASTTLFTNGSLISARTTHREGLQKLRIGKQELDIAKTHKNFSIETDFGIKRVLVPTHDVFLSTKGIWSLSEGSFFNPEFTSLSDGLDFDRQTIDYVMSRYNPSLSVGDWKVTEVTFDVPGLYADDGMLHFAFSLPYLEEGQEGVRLGKIEVKLSGRELLTGDIVGKLKGLLHSR